MKKILFCDMDGTIIDLDGLLYPPDKEKVEKLHQAGHLFAFNTGRNYEEALRSTNKLDLYYDYLVLIMELILLIVMIKNYLNELFQNKLVLIS